MIFGISGCSASGKSFIVNYLTQNILPSKVSFIYQDNYYKSREKQSKDMKGNYNFDLPTAFLNDELINDLQLLKSGKEVFRDEYHFNNSKIKQKKIVTQARPVIILEGLFIFSNLQISEMLDYKIFIDASMDVMLERRIQRDREIRGYDQYDVEYKFENHVKPSYYKYILPEKKNADLIIQNNRDGNKAAKDVLKYIKDLI